MATKWRFNYRVEQDLPPLAWLATIAVDEHKVEVTCGKSVRCEEAGFFEGTWAGPSHLVALPEATTVFGSGIVMDDTSPVVITPAHSVSGAFTHATYAGIVVSNSFIALLAATDAELDPDANYPGRFFGIIDGTSKSPIDLPTSRGAVQYHFYWNLRLGTGGTIKPVEKRSETPFTSYADYRSRLSNALGSSLANAPRYEPVVSLSSGYDSTAVAVLAADHGCRRAVTFAEGRPTRRTGDNSDDSGVATGTRLRMKVETFDRAEYLGRTDLPEAEFLATGMTGEDVVMSTFEPSLHKAVLLTGTMGNGIWRVGGSRRSDLSRSAFDGMSLHEFRLRVDFCLIPLPAFGSVQRASVMDISASAEMKPFSVGGRYDQPISRRIAEEAGLPRGSFASKKRATSAIIHSAGEQALSPATAVAIRHFAQEDGRSATFPPRFEARLWQRVLLRGAPRVGAQRFIAGLTHRRRRLAHFEPEIGTLLLRWAVGVIRPRYRVLSSLPSRRVF